MRQKPAHDPEADAFWQSIQLTPEQKAEARERLEAQSEDAGRNRVWEEFIELEGKVHLEIDVHEAREDRD